MAKVLARRPQRANKPEKSTVPLESGSAIIRDATAQDEWEALEWRAGQYLHMTGTEFLRRWRAGEWADDPDQPGVLECAACVPLAEQYARAHGLS
jgi:hypothetical protein